MKLQRVTKLKATEQYCTFLWYCRSIMLYNVVLIFEFVHEIKSVPIQMKVTKQSFTEVLFFFSVLYATFTFSLHAFVKLQYKSLSLIYTVLITFYTPLKISTTGMIKTNFLGSDLRQGTSQGTVSVLRHNIYEAVL